MVVANSLFVARLTDIIARSGGEMAQLDAFFNFMHEHGASDLHLASGSQPIVRVRGELERLTFPVPQDEILVATGLDPPRGSSPAARTASSTIARWAGRVNPIRCARGDAKSMANQLGRRDLGHSSDISATHHSPFDDSYLK